MSTPHPTDPSERPPTEGLVAGKYQLVRLIGRGGMGSVWEARHVTLGTRVAIKFVDVEQAKSEEARHRFQNEARAAATIQSKHAIKVYDHGLLDDKDAQTRPYIVMELLVGEPLDRRLDLLQRLPLDTVARIVQQVARALQQAHDAGITHRDLKPENIFLERGEEDDEEFAKVLDFGIAKIRDPEAAMSVSSGTKTGILMGTPFYMSPEQARGLKTVDHRSDLWALAVIVYRCVTGSLPFESQALGDLLVKICAGPIPVPSEVVPSLPPALDGWMRRALGREPDERFQTAFEMAESLAMVAGISVRLPSRRSGDVVQAPTARTVISAASDSFVEPHGPTRSAPPPRPLAGGVPDSFAAMRQPVAAVTSSPLTASSPPREASGGFAPLAVAAMAVVVLVAAGGGTAWYVHRADGLAAASSASAMTDVHASVPPQSASAAPSPSIGASIGPPPDPDPPPPAVVAAPAPEPSAPALAPALTAKHAPPPPSARPQAGPYFPAGSPKRPTAPVASTGHGGPPLPLPGSDPGY